MNVYSICVSILNSRCAGRGIRKSFTERPHRRFNSQFEMQSHPLCDKWSSQYFVSILNSRCLDGIRATLYFLAMFQFSIRDAEVQKSLTRIRALNKVSILNSRCNGINLFPRNRSRLFQFSIRDALPPGPPPEDVCREPVSILNSRCTAPTAGSSPKSRGVSILNSRCGGRGTSWLGSPSSPVSILNSRCFS